MSCIASTLPSAAHAATNNLPVPRSASFPFEGPTTHGIREERPELWHLYNTKIAADETMRVFPLSNWTELDVWDYILAENVPVVLLYFAKERPVVERDGSLIMIDDDRLELASGEKPKNALIRFRLLGCYPLSAAVASQATTVADIVQELRTSRMSERSGRLIDADETSSMERKKREGYF